MLPFTHTYSNMEQIRAQLRTPFLMVVSGSTQSGKSEFTKQLLLTPSLWERYPEHIVISYQVSPEQYANVPNATLIRGAPDFNNLRPRTLLVLDDATRLIKNKNSELIDLFCISSHHSDISVILIVHNPFLPELRTARLQAQYHVFFPNATDCSYIQTFAYRSHPGRAKVFLQAFDQATERPHSCLFYDASPECPKHHRLRSHLLEIPQRLYNDGTIAKKRKGVTNIAECEATLASSHIGS